MHHRMDEGNVVLHGPTCPLRHRGFVEVTFFVALVLRGILRISHFRKARQRLCFRPCLEVNLCQLRTNICFCMQLTNWKLIAGLAISTSDGPELLVVGLSVSVSGSSVEVSGCVSAAETELLRFRFFAVVERGTRDLLVVRVADFLVKFLLLPF